MEGSEMGGAWRMGGAGVGREEGGVGGQGWGGDGRRMGAGEGGGEGDGGAWGWGWVVAPQASLQTAPGQCASRTKHGWG